MELLYTNLIIALKGHLPRDHSSNDLAEALVECSEKELRQQKIRM